LLVHTLQNLEKQNPGFNPQNALQFTIEPSIGGYSDAASQNLYKRLLVDLRSVTGVATVSASRFAELTPGRADVGISIPTRSSLLEDNPTIQEDLVGPDFFQAMGMPLISGSGFTLDDNEAAPRVAVLNEAAVRRYFGSLPATSESIRLAGAKDPIEVIGIVRDARYHSLREHAEPMVFVPFLQFPPDAVPRLTFVVRTTIPPAGIMPAVRQQVYKIDAHLPMVDIKTLSDQIHESLVSERLVATLSAVLAFLALIVACVGLYGTLAYSVSQRTNEIGIRMALGADRSKVLILILKQGVTLALAGIAFGSSMALGLTRFMRTLLFGVSPTDVETFLSVGTILIVIALAACLIPALRAASIDPIRALRAE
jgi:predicted permease